MRSRSRARSSGSSSMPAVSWRTRTSAGWRTSWSTWPSTGPAPSPGRSSSRISRSIGMRFGPDVNAYTNFDETVYMLTVPTDAPGVLARGIDILEEWATGITFDSSADRAGAWRDPRGVENRSGRGEPDPESAVPDHSAVQPLSRPHADRNGGVLARLRPRRTSTLLHRLVSARPDVGDRRRRLRSRGDRGDDPGTLRADPSRCRSPAAAGIRGSGAPADLRDRHHRPGSDLFHRLAVPEEAADRLAGSERCSCSG